MISEIEILFWLIGVGILVGIVFDFYRSVRHWLKFGKVLTFITDILFSVLTLFIIFYFFNKVNAITLRFYLFGGTVLGLAVYLRFASWALTKLLLGSFHLIELSIKRLWIMLKIPYRGMVLLMQPFYWALRWLSLLFYRIFEYLVIPFLRQTRRRLRDWWLRLVTRE